MLRKDCKICLVFHLKRNNEVHGYNSGKDKKEKWNQGLFIPLACTSKIIEIREICDDQQITDVYETLISAEFDAHDNLEDVKANSIHSKFFSLLHFKLHRNNYIGQAW